MMNDLAICKRIAEIECVEHLCDRGVVVLSENYSELINTICSGRYSPEQVAKIIDKAAYNPLTDDALNHQLMIKYELDLISPYRKNGDTQWEAQIFTDECCNVESVYDESPNKAILLAIIEAHNETNT